MWQAAGGSHLTREPCSAHLRPLTVKWASPRSQSSAGCQRWVHCRRRCMWEGVVPGAIHQSFLCPLVVQNSRGSCKICPSWLQVQIYTCKLPAFRFTYPPLHSRSVPCTGSHRAPQLQYQLARTGRCTLQLNPHTTLLAHPRHGPTRRPPPASRTRCWRGAGPPQKAS